MQGAPGHFISQIHTVSDRILSPALNDRHIDDNHIIAHDLYDSLKVER